MKKPVKYVLLSDCDYPNIGVAQFTNVKELNSKIKEILSQHYDAEKVKFKPVKWHNYYETDILVNVTIDGESREIAVSLNQTFVY